MRIMHETLTAGDSSFITLTYSDENLPDPPELNTKPLVLFLKRLRKDLGTLRYYACGEYGETYGRPHYHAILFALPPNDQTRTLVAKHWTQGRTHVGTVTPNSARYVADYVQKQLNGPAAAADNRTQPFSIMSQGIGKQWALDHKHQIQTTGIRHRGVQQSVPRYYIDLLNLDTTQLRAAARARSNKERRQRYRSEPRPTHVHLIQDDWNKQADKNIIAKNEIFRKGTL